MKTQHDKLITLMTFDNSFEAHLLESKLADHDIESYIQDENFATLIPLYNNLLGGIKLMINSADLEKARQVLSEIDSTPLTNEKDKIIRCPRCNSDKIDSNFKSIKSIKSFFVMLLALFTVAHPINIEKSYSCLDCNNKFKR